MSEQWRQSKPRNKLYKPSQEEVVEALLELQSA
jgi:hypothetical protein